MKLVKEEVWPKNSKMDQNCMRYDMQAWKDVWVLVLHATGGIIWEITTAFGRSLN